MAADTAESRSHHNDIINVKLKSDNCVPHSGPASGPSQQRPRRIATSRSEDARLNRSKQVVMLKCGCRGGAKTRMNYHRNPQSVSAGRLTLADRCTKSPDSNQIMIGSSGVYDVLSGPSHGHRAKFVAGRFRSVPSVKWIRTIFEEAPVNMPFRSELGRFFANRMQSRIQDRGQPLY